MKGDCLEYLRKAAICRGDTSLATFFWEDDKQKTKKWSDHICVDWDRRFSFAQDHKVLVAGIEMLIGPDRL